MKPKIYKSDKLRDLTISASILLSRRDSIQHDLNKLEKWQQQERIDCTPEINRLKKDLKEVKGNLQILKHKEKLINVMPEDANHNGGLTLIKAQKRLTEARANYKLWWDRSENHTWERLEARYTWELCTREYYKIRGGR